MTRSRRSQVVQVDESLAKRRPVCVCVFCTCAIVFFFVLEGWGSKVPARAAAAEFPGKSELTHGEKRERSAGTNKYICRERGGELGVRKQRKLNKARKGS